MKSVLISVLATAVLIVGLVWFARPDTDVASQTREISDDTLISDEANYDFGTISMAAGKVSHSFRITNTRPEPLVIEKIYTSCMCTTAALSTQGKTFGPFSMPGHGIIPKIDAVIEPGEEATVEVVFDPAAHGPAGVGRIERDIILENNAGAPIQFAFSALVTP